MGTRDIAPSCVENVDELIERQEKSLVQLDSKRNVVNDLIEKGKKILEHPDKPKFLEGNVKRIQEGWDDTKKKAQDRLKLLQDTKEAWVGYAENNETIASEFEVAEEEIKKVKKCAETEAALLPQGGNVDKDAQAFKNELNRITDYVTKLAADTKIECDKYSNDVKFWAEYRTGIKEYSPWLAGAEKAAAEGLS